MMHTYRLCARQLECALNELRVRQELLGSLNWLGEQTLKLVAGPLKQVNHHIFTAPTCTGFIKQIVHNNSRI